MKHYVAALLLDTNYEQVLLIRKSHPQWMAGKLNGIGGHIESNESPLIAMQREFNEETGLINPDWRLFATLEGKEDGRETFRIHWFTATITRTDEWRAAAPSDEPVNWYYVHTVDAYSNTISMPNLKWLIEMAIAHLKGEDRAVRGHTITEW